MKTLRLLITLLSAGVLFSCKDSGTTGEIPETGTIIPLAAGNYWTYEKTDYTADGSVKKTSLDSVSVTTDIKLNVATNWTGYNYEGTRYVANFTDGFWHVGIDLTLKQLWFKYPAKVGDVFRWGPLTRQLAFPVPAKPDSVVKITSNSPDCTVAAKFVSIPGAGTTYQCYQYQTEYRDAKGTVFERDVEYMAANTGKIMEEDFVLDYRTNTLKLASRSKLKSLKLQ